MESNLYGKWVHSKYVLKNKSSHSTSNSEGRSSGALFYMGGVESKHVYRGDCTCRAPRWGTYRCG